jgi:hypothetical protein
MTVLKPTVASREAAMPVFKPTSASHEEERTMTVVDQATSDAIMIVTCNQTKITVYTPLQVIERRIILYMDTTDWYNIEVMWMIAS